MYTSPLRYRPAISSPGNSARFGGKRGGFFSFFLSGRTLPASGKKRAKKKGASQRNGAFSAPERKKKKEEKKEKKVEWTLP
jgi:hypothetical protein